MRNAPPFLRVSCEKELIFDSGGIQKKVTDAAIIEHLKGLDNKQGYIKELILQDMAKAKGDA